MNRPGDQRRRLETALRRAETVRDRLRGVVSHDLRSSLAVIRGLAGLLRDDPPADRAVVANLLTRIIVNAEGAALLAGNTVEASHLEEHAARPLRERVRVADVVENALSRVEASASLREVETGLQMVAGETHAALDPRMIERVLVNLLENAIRFTPEGGNVTVAVGRVDGRLTIEVRDGGPGIDPAVHSELFGLHDGPAGTRRLGLFVAGKLVEAHGGTIAVDSPPRGGTRFTVSLPLG